MRGPRKGFACGVRRCKRHSKVIIQGDGSQTTSFMDLPEDVMRIVIRKIAENTTRSSINNPNAALRSLIALSATNKFVHQLVESDAWQSAWQTYCAIGGFVVTNYRTLSCKDRLLLVSLTGCQFCKAPRIRKIYSEYDVRCCEKCLHERTISDYRLKTDFRICGNMLLGFPYRLEQLYSRHHGTYEVKFYWRAHVEERIGMPLQEYMLLAQDKERQKREADIMTRTESAPFDIEFVKKTTQFHETLDPYELSVERVMRCAWKEYHRITFDEYLKQYNRGHKLLMADIRKTRIYKQALDVLGPKDSYHLTEEQWKMIKDEVYDTYIRDTSNKKLAYNVRCKVFTSEIYRTRKLDWTPLTDEEWQSFTAQPPERKSPSPHIIATHVCPHCNKRLKNAMGVVQHIRDVHEI